MDRGGFDAGEKPARVRLLFDTDLFLSIFEKDVDAETCGALLQAAAEDPSVLGCVTALTWGEIAAHWALVDGEDGESGRNRLHRCLRAVQAFSVIDITRAVAQEAGLLKGAWDRDAAVPLPWLDALAAGVARRISATLVTRGVSLWRDEGLWADPGARNRVLDGVKIYTPEEALQTYFG
ncbi:MAG: PIN domain-containing protein [Alicyclobacillaceae bacterium]|nr:PIN domain-containing protein [Alicyclobacillaceae bacterium]